MVSTFDPLQQQRAVEVMMLMMGADTDEIDLLETANQRRGRGVCASCGGSQDVRKSHTMKLVGTFPSWAAFRVYDWEPQLSFK